MAKLHPRDGGCWFCGEDGEKEPLHFTEQFDAAAHRNCCKRILDGVEDKFNTVQIEVSHSGAYLEAELIWNDIKPGA